MVCSKPTTEFALIKEKQPHHHVTWRSGVENAITHNAQPQKNMLLAVSIGHLSHCLRRSETYHENDLCTKYLLKGLQPVKSTVRCAPTDRTVKCCAYDWRSGCEPRRRPCRSRPAQKQDPRNSGLPLRASFAAERGQEVEKSQKS